MYLEFICPPMPYLIVAGESFFRPGDIHERRVLTDIFDLIVVHKGTLFIQEEESNYQLSAGDYLVLLPEKRHRGFQPCHSDTHFSWVHFSASNTYQLNYSNKQRQRTRMNHKKYYKKEAFSFFMNTQGHLSSEKEKQFKQIMRRLSEVEINLPLHQKKFLSAKVDSFEAQLLFFNLLAIVRTPDISSTENDVASHIYSYIEAHATQPFSLDDLSEKFAYHKSSIIQMVKKRYDITPAQLHKQFRLQKGKDLLAKKQLSIREVSDELGFYDAAYFSKQFKKSFGLSPKDYQNRKEEEH